MSQNPYQKLYEHHKRVNPQSTMTYDSFLDNCLENKKIKEEIKVTRFECDKCFRLKKESEFSSSNGYRRKTCKKCKSKKALEKYHEKRRKL